MQQCHRREWIFLGPSSQGNRFHHQSDGLPALGVVNTPLSPGLYSPLMDFLNVIQMRREHPQGGTGSGSVRLSESRTLDSSIRGPSPWKMKEFEVQLRFSFHLRYRRTYYLYLR